MNQDNGHIPSWTLLNALIQLTGLISVYVCHSSLLWITISFFPFCLIPIFALREKDKTRLLTLPNLISLTRLAATYAAILIWRDEPFIAAVWALGILSLDWVDGWVARTTGQSTRWGSVLDKEIDSILVCLLCILLWWEKGFTPLLLLLAALRYVYVLLRAMIPDHRNTVEPRFKYGVMIAGWFIASLLISLAVPYPFDVVILSLGVIAICYSFGRSYYYLFRHI